MDDLYNHGLIENDIISLKEGFRFVDLEITTTKGSENKDFEKLLNDVALENLESATGQLKLTNLIKVRTLIISVHLKRLNVKRKQTIDMLELIKSEISKS